ncbi:MAG: cytochrome c oxidase subunit I, partial [Candidatus Limnocylindria bacterium]
MATTALSPRAETYSRSWVLDWLTTVDHKKIGILYIVNSFLFFFAAGILALVIRTELAVPGLQFVDEATYNQAFTMHGTIMIFLFVVPVLSGFANYIVPLQLGAPDMAFPRINALSFWLLPLGGLLIFSGYLFGGAAAEGWTLYAPLSNERYSVGTGTDLWLIGLTLVGTASILGAVNMIATIFKMRAPGMTLFRMPIFIWTVLVTATLILLATPVLTAGLIALFIDRN